MLHSNLASGDPKNRPEDTVRWLSVAQYKVFGPRSKASRSPLLQTAHVRVFSRLPYSVFSNCSATVTVSPSGPIKLFKGGTTAMSGVLARFPWLLPVRNSFASYGASAVTRTRGRGHVAEVKTNFHRVFGVSIRVSKETFLPLNVQPVFSF